jgi:hypothetical protein
MALRTQGYNPHHTITETSMSSQQAGTQRGGGRTNGVTGNQADHTLIIGKGGHSIPTVQLAATSDPVWKRQTTFDQLVAVLDSQKGVHAIADLISALRGQLPISTGNAYAESLAVRQKVVKLVTSIDSLQGVEFLSSDGASKIFGSADVNLRPTDLMYFKFTCMLDGKGTDAAVKQDPLSFQFCLRLPQTLLGDPVATKKGTMDPACKRLFGQEKTDRNKKGKEKDDADDDEDDETEVQAEDGTFHTPSKRKEDFSAVASPKMGRLLNSGGQATGREDLSYYGKLDFLDNQEAFDLVFGTSPELLSPFPAEPVDPNTIGVMGMVNVYADKCMFDKFKQACRNDYVGDDEAADPLLAIQDICDKLSRLRQAYKINNRQVVDHPEVLFQKFSDITVGLPEDATHWSIQLCSTYYGALIKEIKLQMTRDKFKMPSINGGFGTKTTQLKALRTVRTAAVAAHDSVEAENDRIKKLVSQMNGGSTRHNHNSHYFTSTEEDTAPSSDTGTVFFQSDSQAEQTIARYTGGNGGRPQPNAAPVTDFRTGQNQQQNVIKHTKINPATGEAHPYNPHTDYVSKFPVGYKRCFRCEGDHGRNRPCPLEDDLASKKAFWQELWAHKPSTFDPSRMRSSNNSRYGPSSSQTVSINIQIISKIRLSANQHNQIIRLSDYSMSDLSDYQLYQIISLSDYQFIRL